MINVSIEAKTKDGFVEDRRYRSVKKGVKKLSKSDMQLACAHQVKNTNLAQAKLIS